MPPLDDEAARADEVAAAVASCASVVRLVADGAGAAVATYLPGRRVEGVRLTQDGVEVSVVARWAPSIPAAAEEIRTAVRRVVGDTPVLVRIADLEVPPDTPASYPPGEGVHDPP